MTGNEAMDDAGFADRAMRELPTAAVGAGLEARILADFDRIAAGAKPGWLSRLLNRNSRMLWPGAPVWRPASILALSLVAGITAGAFVPSLNPPVAPVAPVSTDQVIATWDNDVDLDMDL